MVKKSGEVPQTRLQQASQVKEPVQLTPEKQTVRPRQTESNNQINKLRQFGKEIWGKKLEKGIS